MCGGKVSLYILIFLICLSQLGECILCWSCRSDLSPACSDTFDTKFNCGIIEECEEDSKETPMCTKIKFKYRNMTEPVVYRGCYKHCLRAFSNCIEVPGIKAQYEKCYTCRDDLCNAAQKTLHREVSAFSIFILIIVNML